jgi:serine/threonine protein kinase
MGDHSLKSTKSNTEEPAASSTEPTTHGRFRVALAKAKTTSLKPFSQYVIGGLAFEVDTRYAIKSVVGRGAYGVVCAAVDTSARSLPPASDKTLLGRPPCNTVAVKKCIEPFNNQTDCKRLLREIRLLRCLRHPNVLRLSDLMPPASLSPNTWKDVYLVTRLFDTNLHRVIYSGQPLTDPHVQYIVWQLFRALRYLHAAQVVHRDMKPTNLLLNRNCELALADFGMARYMPAAEERKSSNFVSSTSGAEPRSKSGQLTKYVVTRWYRAPELLVQNKRYDSKVDMWSVGCILAEVIGAKAFFPGKDSLHQLRLVVEKLGTPSPEELVVIENEEAVKYIMRLRHKDSEGPQPSVRARLTMLFANAAPLLLHLLAQLLQFDPAKRLTASEALSHPYLAAYHDAPEEDLPAAEIEMDFEQQSPTKEELRSLVWEEVLRYHPDLRNRNRF